MVKVLASAAMAAVVALTLSACAPTPTKEGTGGYIDDTVVTTKVKTFKGRVQLSGFVSSPQMARHAVEVTRSVPGVKSVVNNMQVWLIS